MMKNQVFFALCFSLFFHSPLHSYQAKDYTHLIGTTPFSEQLLQMHFKLYQGYVKNTNELLEQLKILSETGKSSSYQFGALKRRLGWEFDGMRLHELYFDNLGGNGKMNPKDPLILGLTRQYGSIEKWKQDFIATGMSRGIGWVILYFDPLENRWINAWINEHDQGHLAKADPLLIMDVFEHAYLTQWGLNREQYIDAFFSSIRWDIVSLRYQKTRPSG